MQVSVQFNEKGDAVVAMYFRLSSKKVSETREQSDAINIDLDSGGNIIGVEVLDPASLSALMDIADHYDAPELKKIEKLLEKTFA